MNFFFKEFPEHLYVHLPFCARRCSYCDFVALVAHENFIPSYNSALINEIKLFAQNLDCSKTQIKTLFFGGGTPSLYPTYFLEEIFYTLCKNFDLSELQETTLEANPADINATKLSLWKRFGINRLSIGVQALDDDVLHKLNRYQKIIDVINAVEVAVDFFENISIDLMLGLPGISEDKWMSTLKTVATWPIKHISIYMLTIYDKTPIFFKFKKDGMENIFDESFPQIYESTNLFLKSSGFVRYEISNFSKNGYESIHNIGYWERRPYYGFGLGAASFDGKSRYTNQKNLEKYIQSIDIDNKLPIDFFETLTIEQEILEKLMLGLRMQKGIDLQSVFCLFSNKQKEAFLYNMNRLTREEFLVCNESRICLTSKGVLFENKVVLDLMNRLF